MIPSRASGPQTVRLRGEIRFRANWRDNFVRFEARAPVPAASPAEASRRRRPQALQLAQENDAAEVVGVVGPQAFQLLANGHGARRQARARGADDRAIEAPDIGCGCRGLLTGGEETLAELVPGFTLDIVWGGEAIGCVDRIGRLDGANPVQCDLLPECDMPQLLINGA